jgi:hypothetical protein
MENISTLNRLTWPFQLMGLQNLQLNIVGKPSTSKYPSTFYFIVISFWVVLNTTFIASFAGLFVKAHLENQGNLKRVMLVLTYYIDFVLILIALSQTFFKHKKIVDFYQKSQEIVRLFYTEFAWVVEFSRFKRRVMIVNLVTCICFVGFVTQEYFDDKKQFDSSQIVLLYISKVNGEFMLLKYFFCVYLIKFFLGSLNLVIKKDLVKFNPNSRVKFLKIFPINDSERRKILMIRRIYFLIVENADIINQTMGMIIFIQLIVFVLDMVEFGYAFYSTAQPVAYIYCEYFKPIFIEKLT